MIFLNHLACNSTPLRPQDFGDSAWTCQSIVTLDSINQYGKCLCYIPVSREIIRLASEKFVAKYPDKRFSHYKFSETVISFHLWNNKDLRNPQTFLMGGEKRCSVFEKQYRPDLYCEKIVDGSVKAYILEVNGCMYHKCSFHHRDDDELHPFRKNKYGVSITWGVIFEADEDRKKTLEKEYPGAEFHIIEECAFRANYMSKRGQHRDLFDEFMRTHPTMRLTTKEYSESEMFRMIYEKKIEGFILVDLDCDDELRKQCEHFPLIFVKAEIRKEMLPGA